ncbi:hypothetical protein EUX98_g2280 [Antrodiella citrinella]|uniref:Calcineurin-like phosphoesterase domain-containing protein n=1 Tax=Antrodiella citrinella TaxID=2447956 RepID=A0A4V3XJ71_9APHY|nr:hypothetical protein EUX98_g2280 [Antrodiella citrinella]
MFSLKVAVIAPFVGLAASQAAAPIANTTNPFGPLAFTAPGAFPTSIYKEYFNDPTATSAQVQPVITDPVLHKTYPHALTDPANIPQNDTEDPHPLPPKASDALLLAHAIEQISSIATNPVFGDDTCTRCQAGLEVAKFLAMAAPSQGPTLAVAICNLFNFKSNCEDSFGLQTVGSIITQVVANADAGGLDGQLLCNNFLSLCPVPPVSPLNLTTWFAKPKPTAVASRKPSGKRLKILHVSDLHIDPRYANGAESNCTTGQCCRENIVNRESPQSPLVPAPRFGAYKCDSPYALILAAFESIPTLTGTQKTGFDWTILTGDLVSHDPAQQLSRDYTLYTETVLYDLLKRTLGSGPVYAALGNHDTYNETRPMPSEVLWQINLAGGFMREQLQDTVLRQNRNYDHVAGLWQHEGWLPDAAVTLARAHYAAYSVQRQDGIRIITLNTDMWYTANYFNYINTSTSDNSGMLRFLTDELQSAEDAGDKAWILGHVLSGWDGTNAMGNPTNLFYQIVDRFSDTITGIFWGHTHEDELQIFYANNATIQSDSTAQNVAWISPSLTPLTNLNSGFRVYEVDSNTFEIVDAHTFKSDVNSFGGLDHQLQDGPTYVYEYNTRETYGGNITWGPNDPLNATWWHKVTEQMEVNPALVETFNTLQGKTSVRTQPCTGECVTAKICYLRSGSVPIAFENCPAGFGSVQ